MVRTQDAIDKRVKRLSLTSSGKERIAQLVDIHNSWLSQIMNCLTEEEQIQFENYCNRLLVAAETLTPNRGGRTA